MDEKYGFVYLWKDNKHGRFYIGCHWGTEDDGYICSSTWMKNSYKRRPENFKRRILARVHTNRKDLLEEEYRWLSMVKDQELKTKYYNVHKHHFNHWSVLENRNAVIKSVSEKTKEAMQRPEIRQRFEEGLKTRKNTRTPEQKERRRLAIIEGWKTKSPPETRKVVLQRGSEELSKVYSEASKKRWSKPGAKERASKVQSERQKGVPKPYLHDLRWWNDGNTNVRRKDCPGENWKVGRVPK